MLLSDRGVFRERTRAECKNKLYLHECHRKARYELCIHMDRRTITMVNNRDGEQTLMTK